ncbi:MAG: lmo0937 family membrane protein [Pyrinomonadaceae bacterium]
MLWKIIPFLLTLWFIGILAGRGGLWHMLVVCAIAMIVIQLVASWRTAQG